MIGCLPTQALAFLTVFVYATHATQAIAFEWKPGLSETHVVYSWRQRRLPHREWIYDLSVRRLSPWQATSRTWRSSVCPWSACQPPLLWRTSHCLPPRRRDPANITTSTSLVAFTPETCSRIQVSRPSNLYQSTCRRIQVLSSVLLVNTSAYM